MRIASHTRALVTGASGALGWAVARLLGPRCTVTSVYLTHACVPVGTAGVRLDLAEPSAIARIMDRVRPDLIIHLAAIADPDRCERDSALAFRVNFEATREIASLAARSGRRLVFVSTDLVFDGIKGNYTEEDSPRPLGIYGMSKLRGEEAVATCRDALVLRSALVYGTGSPVSPTFFGRTLRNLSLGKSVQLFTDQKRNPILVDDLARAIAAAIERDLSGLYHVGGPEVVTRYEFGKRICEIFGYDKALLVPVRMEEFAYAAKRPLDATLDISKLRRALDFTPCTLREGLGALGTQARERG